VVAAYVLGQTEVGKAAQVANDSVKIEGVPQAEDVTGPYDVIARAETRNPDELASWWSRACSRSTVGGPIREGPRSLCGARQRLRACHLPPAAH
jgi:hypothetical protein